MRIQRPTITQIAEIKGDGAILTGSFSGSFTGEYNTAILSSSGQIADLGAGILSGSAQIGTDISGSFTAASSSISTRITTAESELGNTLLSSSAQIADDISGSFGAASSSLASRITSNDTDIAGLNTYTGSLKTAISVSGANTTLLGNLTVQGTQTALDTTTLNVADLNILVASGAADAAAANGAGLTVGGASANLTYDSTGDKWEFNKGLDISGSLTTSGSDDQVNTITGITKFNNGFAIDQGGNISGSNFYNIQGTNGLTVRHGDGSTGGSLSLNSGGATLAGSGTNTITIGNNQNTINVQSNGGFGSNGGNVTIGSQIYGTGTETAGDVTIQSLGGTNGTAGTITLDGAEIQATGSIKALNDVIVSNDVQADSIGIGTAASGTTGEIRATGDITAFYSSDERLKENFTPLAGALDKVKAIGGYEFDWKEGIEDIVSKKGHDIGVKAQELQAQYPDLVHERDNGYLAVDYIKLNAVLIEAVKELAAKVEELSK